ncbi:hypothetical protein FHS72_001218 [Loktanella ponticola]|uniref:Uncharacterized protein n=1 Tax=Yoonia ponticola TaxID=1524255 RepID=A0A7W9BJQ8_9RHOB|nr:hypothetical protein [Yoonia ponticola]MBB5721606.1 hypothetical protein [Yoonia ponticola]
MSEYTDNTANELADKALAEAELCGDDKIVDRIGEILGASSQSLEEAYLTAIRVRRAEKRARALLADSAAKRVAATAAALAAETPDADAPSDDDGATEIA